MSRRGGRQRGGRSNEQEKIIAQTFLKFLEDKNRKEDMLRNEMKLIYEDEFREMYETLGMPFSRLLNKLTYHLNACQLLQDRVIFGGGEAASLQLFTDDPEESDDNEDEDENYILYAMMSVQAFYCKVCRRDLGDRVAYINHTAGVKHRQQRMLKKIRKSLAK